MKLQEVLINLKLKYITGILCCILLVLLLTETRHLRFVPQWHMLLTEPHKNVWITLLPSNSTVERRLVLATHDGILSEYAIPGTLTDVRKVLPELTPNSIGTGNRQIEVIKSATLNGSNVLGVLTKGGNLKLLDARLRQRWHRQLIPGLSKHARLHSGAIHISDVCISAKQCGVVFVGVAYTEDHNHELHKNEDTSKLEHFSSFALSGQTGDVIWHHLPGDFIARNDTMDELISSPVSQHWKLQLLRQHKMNEHIGEKPWPLYKTDILRILPHNWKSLADTTLHVDTFGKWHRQSERPRLDHMESRSGDANVLVAKYHAGIDILDLRTGRPRTRLELGQGAVSTVAGLYSGGEDNLYEIRQFSRLDQEKGILCGAEILPLEPSEEDLPWAPTVENLCAPVSYMDYPRFREEAWTDDMTKSVPPLVLPSYGKPGGLWGIVFHLLGGSIYTGLLKDLIFVTSDGLMTSYSSAGHINWRSNAQISWLYVSQMVNRKTFTDSDMHRVYEDRFLPSLTPMNVAFGREVISSVLAIGWESLSLTDLRDGHLLASHDLPCHPAEKPIIFGNNIVIHCDNMLIGIHVAEASRLIYMVILSLVLALLFIFLTWCCDPDNPVFGDFWI